MRYRHYLIPDDFYLPQKKLRTQLAVTSYFFLYSSHLKTTNPLFLLYGFAYSEHFLWMESNNMWPFVILVYFT